MKKLFIVLGMLLVVTSMVFAQEKPTVVIVPFDVVDVDKNEANVLFEVFTSKFAGLGNARVVDRNSFDKIKAQHAFQTSDWSNSDKIAQLGKALNANMVITGQLMSFKGTLVATFRMLDVNTVEIIATATERTSGTDELFGKLESMAKKLTNNINSSSGTVVKISYNIGDEGPGGGIIFYYSEEGFDVYQADGSIKRCNYLECSKMEVAYVSWCPSKNDSYCCSINTSRAVGMGKMNTYKIINGKHNGGAVSSSNCAAKACFEYYTAQTAKGEWFLPSEGELYWLNKNLETRILATSTDETLVSSSQKDYDSIFFAHFDESLSFITDYASKVGWLCVRAIRAF